MLKVLRMQVVSNKMMKSVLVSVARWKIFPKYKLRKRWTKKFMVSFKVSSCSSVGRSDVFDILLRSVIILLKQIYRRMMRKTSATWEILSESICPGKPKLYSDSYYTAW